MKRHYTLYIIALLLVLICTMTSCKDNQAIESTITVSDDGYVVVNGVKTEYEVKTSEKCSHDFDENGVCSICQAVNPDKTHYLVTQGTRIEDLPISEQEKIGEYVADCKKLLTGRYANVVNRILSYEITPYISFTETFIYDFRNIDENDMDNRSSMLWNRIKEFNGGESKPIMYIEFSGYAQYFPRYKLNQIQELSLMHGFFIFENETVLQSDYKLICNMYYVYELISGTEIINCGDKYAEEVTSEEIESFYSLIENGTPPNSLLKRLTVIE